MLPVLNGTCRSSRNPLISLSGSVYTYNHIIKEIMCVCSCLFLRMNNFQKTKTKIHVQRKKVNLAKKIRYVRCTRLLISDQWYPFVMFYTHCSAIEPSNQKFTFPLTLVLETYHPIQNIFIRAQRKSRCWIADKVRSVWIWDRGRERG